MVNEFAGTVGATLVVARQEEGHIPVCGRPQGSPLPCRCAYVRRLRGHHSPFTFHLSTRRYVLPRTDTDEHGYRLATIAGRANIPQAGDHKGRPYRGGHPPGGPPGGRPQGSPLLFTSVKIGRRLANNH